MFFGTEEGGGREEKSLLYARLSVGGPPPFFPLLSLPWAKVNGENSAGGKEEEGPSTTAEGRSVSRTVGRDFVASSLAPPALFPSDVLGDSCNRLNLFKKFCSGLEVV